jgi:hypothetical protein
MGNKLSTICPRCYQRLVPAKLILNGGATVFNVLLCDCAAQPVSTKDIQEARKSGETLVYVLEVAKNGKPA